jgi:L-aminopeptidase/D-esterase-like protein
MSRSIQRATLAGAILACVHAIAASAAQETLTPVLNSGDKILQIDWPMLRIGTGEYEAGPTGVTVFHFDRKVLGAVDVRGGGPGTVNTDYLRLGYDTPELDTVVFAGGSWYGLETITAVATALKDDGIRDGGWMNLALSVGAIIYDLGDRRLNEIYPDKQLAQAAFRAARPGIFPLGAHGAGRSARSGGYFGCNAYSGQGGAFRQIGDLKIAAFTVVNALGVVTTRDGRVAACYVDAAWPKDLRAVDLVAGLPGSRKPGWTGSKPQPALTNGAKRNTTISLVVTNQKMNPAELQRLAVQVHTSMARAIQPLATEFDGDVLYAVSTGELEHKEAAPAITSADIGIIASDVMWDAILASVPEQPVAAKVNARAQRSAADLRRYAGEYVFSEFAKVQVTADGGKLFAQATGARDAFAIRRNARVELLPVAVDEFMVLGRYPLTVKFTGPEQLVLNPGRWEQVGGRQK